MVVDRRHPEVARGGNFRGLVLLLLAGHLDDQVQRAVFAVPIVENQEGQTSFEPALSLPPRPTPMQRTQPPAELAFQFADELFGRQQTSRWVVNRMTERRSSSSRR